MGLPAGLSSFPKAKTLSAARNGPRGVQTSTPGTINCGLFEGHGLRKKKASQQPGEPEEIPGESSGRDVPRDGACHDNRIDGASQGLRRGRGRPF